MTSKDLLRLSIVKNFPKVAVQRKTATLVGTLGFQKEYSLLKGFDLKHFLSLFFFFFLVSNNV